MIRRAVPESLSSSDSKQLAFFAKQFVTEFRVLFNESRWYLDILVTCIAEEGGEEIGEEIQQWHLKTKETLDEAETIAKEESQQ